MNKLIAFAFKVSWKRLPFSKITSGLINANFVMGRKYGGLEGMRDDISANERFLNLPYNGTRLSLLFS